MPGRILLKRGSFQIETYHNIESVRGDPFLPPAAKIFIPRLEGQAALNMDGRPAVHGSYTFVMAAIAAAAAAA